MKIGLKFKLIKKITNKKMRAQYMIRVEKSKGRGFPTEIVTVPKLGELQSEEQSPTFPIDSE